MITKSLILLRGLPGSGKSTLAKIIDPQGYCTCEADQFMVNKNTGEYQFNRMVLDACHKLCQQKVRTFMEDNKVNEQFYSSIIVSNTGTTEKEIQPYIDLAKEYGYNVHSVIVENRSNTKSVHGVPESTLLKMKNRFDVKL